MAMQSEEQGKRVGENLQRSLKELKGENQGLLAKVREKGQEVEKLKSQLVAAERESAKMRNEFKKKEETLLAQFEAEKEELTRNLHEKLKKHLKEKEDKFSKS